MKPIQQIAAAAGGLFLTCTVPMMAVPANALAAPPVAHAASATAVLTATDAQAYSAAFAALRRGDFDGSVEAVAHVKDPCLMGRLTFERLMHPAYTSTFAELKAWLAKYHDQPEADRVWTLARKRQVAADLPLPAPDADVTAASDQGAWARVERVAERMEAPSRPKAVVSKSLQAARDAFYGGNVDLAYKLSRKAGERWVLGLSAYRLNHFDEATKAFAALSQDRTQNDWVRSAGAFWAARAAIAAGHAEKAPAYLRTAATTPYTFYGLIAERQLGLEPAVGPDGFDAGDADSNGDPVKSNAQGTAATGLKALIHKDKRAHRAAAFAQIGLKAEAGLELRTALLGAGTDPERRRWAGLALALDASLSSPADLSRGRRRFDLAAFQTPEFYPLGGYTVDKALVYALIKQESRFNPDAASTAGAYGLMQLTPLTAARVTQDDGLVRDPTPLKDPAINLRIGQDYLSRLLDATKGDLLHAIAAYNSGPGVIARTASQMPGADSLLVFESMPGGQTREYVQRVIANYWIYRLMSGQPSRTLDAAAGAAKAIKAVLDQP